MCWYFPSRSGAGRRPHPAGHGEWRCCCGTVCGWEGRGARSQKEEVSTGIGCLVVPRTGRSFVHRSWRHICVFPDKSVAQSRAELNVDGTRVRECLYPCRKPRIGDRLYSSELDIEDEDVITNAAAAIPQHSLFSAPLGQSQPIGKVFVERNREYKHLKSKYLFALSVVLTILWLFSQHTLCSMHIFFVFLFSKKYHSDTWSKYLLLISGSFLAICHFGGFRNLGPPKTDCTASGYLWINNIVTQSSGCFLGLLRAGRFQATDRTDLGKPSIQTDDYQEIPSVWGTRDVALKVHSGFRWAGDTLGTRQLIKWTHWGLPIVKWSSYLCSHPT